MSVNFSALENNRKGAGQGKVKPLTLLALTLAVSLAGLGLWHTRQQNTELAQSVYLPLASDRQPLPPELTDPKVFAGLPPLRGTGRYTAPLPSALEATDMPSTEQRVGSYRVSRDASAQAAGLQRLPNVDAGVMPTVLPAAQQQLTPQTVRQLPKLRVLLIGMAEAKQPSSDLLTVLLLDPKTSTISALSLPGQTRVRLPERGIDRLDAAYKHGGTDGQTTAVERLLGVPMDYVVELGPEGLQQAVDLLGGVSVQPAQPFTVGDRTFEARPTVLRGADVVAYTASGDTDERRTLRQQEVVLALVNKVMRLSPSEGADVLRQMQGDLKLNLTPQQVTQLALQYRQAFRREEALPVLGRTHTLSGKTYYVVTSKERRRLHQALQ